MQNKPTIIIAGASGFIGNNLINELSEKYNVKALSRKNLKSDKVNWVKCDLYNLRETEEAFNGCDYLVYLVHSMNKGTRLTQAEFEDLDLIIADNAAKAAKKSQLKQIIYLGGIIPPNEENLSRHLKSRQEVETILSCSGIPVTRIRAAIIIGAGSTSFKMVFSLVKKLKFMICPKWTNSLSYPVDVDDVVKMISLSIANEETYNETIDAFGPEKLTYIEFMQMTAKSLGLKRYIYPISFSTLYLSKFWVVLITGQYYEIVSPLVDSLKYNMIPKNIKLFQKYIPNPISLKQSLDKAIAKEKETKKKIIKLSKSELLENNVRSVQRLFLPDGWNAIDVAQEYTKWLPKFLFFFIRSQIEGEYIHFKLFGIKLLTLYHSTDRSSLDRQLFYIRGGFLVKKPVFPNARLEFRISPHEQSVVAAIHDFYPSLPWYIYRFTQAVAHALVMELFNKFLREKSLNKEAL
ncbi:NAD-dependent epimerase/dehydratase family protein [Fluviispira multicolorata]|uniref:NAD(P)H-binding protein n=1 Tax=Fluviispira multicolorata TaxID=2654512 RepID=A0A833N079_9BACT|nr:NAD(P)H-binding protein [Fluviispira multicolorata]KAB8028073.1 NAD(P)H-binding protein [Fluviispira multicolorata]